MNKKWLIRNTITNLTSQENPPYGSTPEIPNFPTLFFFLSSSLTIQIERVKLPYIKLYTMPLSQLVYAILILKKLPYRSS